MDTDAVAVDPVATRVALPVPDTVVVLVDPIRVGLIDPLRLGLADPLRLGLTDPRRLGLLDALRLGLIDPRCVGPPCADGVAVEPLPPAAACTVAEEDDIVPTVPVAVGSVPNISSTEAWMSAIFTFASSLSKIFSSFCADASWAFAKRILPSRLAITSRAESFTSLWLDVSPNLRISS